MSWILVATICVAVIYALIVILVTIYLSGDGDPRDSDDHN